MCHIGQDPRDKADAHLQSSFLKAQMQFALTELSVIQ